MIRFPSLFRARRAALLLFPVLAVTTIPSGAASNSRSPFPESGFDALQTVRVHYLMDTVSLENTKRGWVVVPGGIPVEESMLSGLRSLLGALHTEQRVGGRKGEPGAESLGLGVAEAWGVQLFPKRGKPTRVWVNLNPAERAVYWRYGEGRDAGTAYRVFDAPWRLSVNQDAWKTRALFSGTYNALDVARIFVRWRDSADVERGYTLQKLARDSARIVEPDTLQITLRKAAEVFVLTDQFAVFRHLPAGATIPPGAPERVRVRITLDDGTVHEAAAHDGGDPLAYHVLHPATGTPVLVERWRFDKFARTLDDLTAFPEYGPEFLPWAVDPDAPGTGVWAPHRGDEHGEEEHLEDPFAPDPQSGDGH